MLYQTKILPFAPKHDWMTPSQAQPKSEFGHENHTKFKIVARLNDGHPVWTGWFDDRDDADAFLYAAVFGNLHQQPALWDLPLPSWSPAYGEQLTYYFSTVVYITAVATNSYTTPSTWNDGNIIECIAGGGGGGNGPSHANGGTGGGGGGYTKGTAFGISPSTTVTINIGAAGAQNGNGESTYFNGTSLATSSVGAQYGGRGYPNSNTLGAGGKAANAVGATLAYSGGDGGKKSYGGGGGGGAAGPNGNGVAGTGAVGAVGGTGGNGDAGSGGAGGAMDHVGGNGTEYTASIGCGGGGGGGGGDANISGGSKGGNYGAGGGGGGQDVSNGTNGAAGTQGFMVITYGLGYATPGFWMFF